MLIVILGAGEIGFHIALSLSRENREVVLVESSSAVAQRIDEDENDIEIIHGNAADPDVLLRAGLRRCSLLVAVTNSDEVNTTACFFASRLAPRVRRIARIRHFDTRTHGHLLSEDPPVVHSLINPEELCARKIRDLIRYPGASDINWFFEKNVVLVRTPVTENSPVSGKSLLEIGQLRVTSTRPFLVAMLVRNNLPRVPGADDILQPGDQILSVTLTRHLDVILDVLCGAEKRRRYKSTTIFGGTGIGLYLSEMLEADGMVVKLVEPDRERAEWLAERLGGTTILCGEPLDSDIFDEERIASSDVFVGATQDQEDNVITALYAKANGVRAGMALLKRKRIERLVSQVGLDGVILPQDIAIGKILEHVREGEITSVTVVNDSDMEVLEMKVSPNAKLAGKPLKKMRIPSESLILAVQEKTGEIVVPGGEFVIHAGDRVSVITHKKHIGRVEHLITGSRGSPPTQAPL